MEIDYEEEKSGMKGKYMAYVGSYSYSGKSKGLTVFDVDVVKGTFAKRCEMEVNNSSYVIVSNNGKNLYSICDEGVASFRILENGSLSPLNTASIKGMRGCHLSTDKDDKFLFVSGYHDGKSTVMALKPDGSVGNIICDVFHKGLGSVAERNFRPHVSCTRLTPDGKFVMVADLGIDQIKIYRFDGHNEEMLLVDAIRCERESAPKCFRFSSDGKFIYLLYELKNVIDVYTYETGDRTPKIEKIQTISTTGDVALSQLTAASAMRFSTDEKHMFCGNAGDNTVSIYKRDVKTGLLKFISCLPISGEYPKDIAVFPDNKHIASVNHESGSITFFNVDFEKGLLVMSGKTLRVGEPNSCAFVRVRD